MKEYLMIFRGPSDMLDHLSPAEAQAQMQKWFVWVENLTRKGHYVAGQPLEDKGKTFRKKSQGTDGPFMEGKELVGGYFLLKAESFEKACSLADDYPSYEFGGSVEVRPIEVITMP